MIHGEEEAALGCISVAFGPLNSVTVCIDPETDVEKFLLFNPAPSSFSSTVPLTVKVPLDLYYRIQSPGIVCLDNVDLKHFTSLLVRQAFAAGYFHALREITRPRPFVRLRLLLKRVLWHLF